MVSACHEFCYSCNQKTVSLILIFASIETGDLIAEFMAEIWIEAIGLFAGLLGIVAWLPQIREVWVLKKHEGISIPTFSIVTIALCLWLVYGVLINSIAMIIANVVTLAAIAAVLIGVIRIRRIEASTN